CTYIPSHTQSLLLFFSLYDAPTTAYHTLSLHDALPISPSASASHRVETGSRSGSLRSTRSAASSGRAAGPGTRATTASRCSCSRSEEHTSELQSHLNLVCRLLLEKKKNTTINYLTYKLL